MQNSALLASKKRPKLYRISFLHSVIVTRQYTETVTHRRETVHRLRSDMECPNKSTQQPMPKCSLRENSSQLSTSRTHLVRHCRGEPCNLHSPNAISLEVRTPTILPTPLNVNDGWEPSAVERPGPPGSWPDHRRWTTGWSQR